MQAQEFFAGVFITVVLAVCLSPLLHLHGYFSGIRHAETVAVERGAAEFLFENGSITGVKYKSCGSTQTK